MVKLNIPERLILVNLIVEKGSFATLRMIEELKQKLHPSEDETKKFEITQTGETISWNNSGLEPSEIELTDGQKEFVIKTLKNLDEKEIATPVHYALYKKLSEEKE